MSVVYRTVFCLYRKADYSEFEVSRTVLDTRFISLDFFTFSCIIHKNMI